MFVVVKEIQIKSCLGVAERVLGQRGKPEQSWKARTIVVPLVDQESRKTLVI